MAGAYLGLALTRRVLEERAPAPETLPPALQAPTRTLERPEGGVNLYVREGTGTPIVLVHSFNAAASSREMKPIFEHLAAATDRPVVAMDWLGFGRSARPDRDYTPEVYLGQLYDVLDDAVEGPADVVALSLGCEYAAHVALQAAPLVRRLVLIAPTGLTADRGPSSVGKIMLSAAARTGLFDVLFYRLTRRASLRSFYERQVFLDPGAIPNSLLHYATVTTHAKGAAHAPLRFVDGSLFLDDVAGGIYSRLYRPTLLLTPADPAPTVQRFDRLPKVLEANPRDLQHAVLPGGLLPQYEAPDAFFEALDGFVSES
jgi:pimeloyl-ACP methyl ester carboxylesterase